MTHETIEASGSQLVPIQAWTAGVPVETSARQQLVDAASLPFVWPHVAVMPDVHFGIGATVGSVIPTEGAIVPAAVGVDLGCGMIAMRTSLDSRALGDNGQPIFEAISAAVPHGRTDDGGANDRGAWRDVPDDVALAWSRLSGRFVAMSARTPKLDTKRQPMQLGTLGTGNHFIEVCLDEEDRVWIMLHSGSRGIGNRIGSHFIAAAKKRCEAEGIPLPNRDLAWLPEGTPEFSAYVEAVAWAQEYALANRRVMMLRASDALASVVNTVVWHGESAVECHHNYVNRETHFGRDLYVTRKGAVSARLGELGIIPGSMGTKSFIVRGKGNADSFHSCSHGAGRVMSRTAAKKTITLEQHAEDTAGVTCRKDAGVLDESPRAYKSVDDVLAAQADLVEVVHTLKSVVCVKG
jgi:tRNA-splicing ligase RtcB (3'-phosphate/5'-hydroxy nucleic acid ligase)